MKKKYIMIRFSDDEYDRIQEIAKKLNTNASAFVRDCVNQHLPLSLDDKIKAAISKKGKGI